MALKPSRNTPLSSSPIIGLGQHRPAMRLPRWFARHPWPVWALGGVFVLLWAGGLAALVYTATRP